MAVTTTPDHLRGIVLDLDDTLVFEHEYVKSGFSTLARSLAQTEQEQRDYQAWLSEQARLPSDGQTFNRLLVAFPELQTRTTIAALIEMYRDHTPDIVLSEEWRTALHRWRSEGLYLALISDGALLGQQRKVEALGLVDLLDLMLLTDHHGREFWKPNEFAFREVERHSDLTGSQLVYVGDNVLKDFIAPNQLGWRSVRLRLPGQLRAHLDPAESTHTPQQTVKSIPELFSLIDAWKSKGTNDDH